MFLLLDHLRVPVTDTYCSNVMQVRTSALLQGRVLGGRVVTQLYDHLQIASMLTLPQQDDSNSNSPYLIPTRKTIKHICMYICTYQFCYRSPWSPETE